MNAPSQLFGSTQPRATVKASSTSLRWAALVEAGQVVAMLAGLGAERPGKEIRNFPALIRDAEKWRRDMADNGCVDLAAVMEPGIAALLEINARGADCKPAALALWHEFVAARTAMLALLPQDRERDCWKSA